MEGSLICEDKKKGGKLASSSVIRLARPGAHLVVGGVDEDFIEDLEESGDEGDVPLVRVRGGELDAREESEGKEWSSPVDHFLCCVVKDPHHLCEGLD